MIRVVLADDQALVREGFRLILEVEPDIDVVGEAADGAEVIDTTRKLNADVVLMDIQMPGIDGIEATRRISRAGLRARILVLTTFDREDYVYEAMRAGASGFLLKDIRREQLVDAIRTVAAGDALLAPVLLKRLIEDLCRRPAPSQGRPSQLAELSDRELQVLTLVARGLANTDIARELFLGEATVKTHLANTLRKLGLRDRVQAVIAAYECGLIRPGDA